MSGKLFVADYQLVSAAVNSAVVAAQAIPLPESHYAIPEEPPGWSYPAFAPTPLPRAILHVWDQADEAIEIDGKPMFTMPLVDAEGNQSAFDFIGDPETTPFIQYELTEGLRATDTALMTAQNTIVYPYLERHEPQPIDCSATREAIRDAIEKVQALKAALAQVKSWPQKGKNWR